MMATDIDLDKLEARATAVVDAREAYSASKDGSVAESEAFLALNKAGEALDELGDPAVVILSLIASAREAAAEIERLRDLLKPFAVYYEINDLDERLADDAIEVPVGDLRAVYRAIVSRAAHTGQG